MRSHGSTATPAHPPGCAVIGTLSRTPIARLAHALPRALAVAGAPARALATVNALATASVIATALALAVAPASALATPALEWSAPATFDSGHTPTAVSCASEAACVVVDKQGYALLTGEPATAAQITTQAVNAVSCAPGAQCVAVADAGEVIFDDDPASNSWTSPRTVDGATNITSVSCPTSSLCVAVDEDGNALTSTNPGSVAWTRESIDPGNALTAVSCASASLCVAVDDAGHALVSTDPSGGAGTWHTQTVGFGELTGVSCDASDTCVAVDSSGEVLASADPAGSGSEPATWIIRPLGSAERLTGVSCASAGVCVAVSADGQAFANDDPASSAPTWNAYDADGAQPLTGISCLPAGLCVALDSAGRDLTARVPAPEAKALTPEVSATSALLRAEVNANDAVLGACTFEYGLQGAYTGSVPCAVLPAATGGLQGVSAAVGELAPNTAYDYRVSAASARGRSISAAVTFTTLVSPEVAIVHPNPSITGTPAPNQQLTCHANVTVPTGISVKLSYVWLRDQVVIPEANASTYTVKFQDSGHHLQCEVTATDGGGSASAKSAFVTVPAGGVPASAAETVIGSASVHGTKVAVPVTCAAHASGGCALALRLTAFETLRASRVVAIAAHRSRAAHKSSSSLRRLALTLASARVRVAAGAHATVTLTLTKAAARLLKALHHFTCALAVSGTLIGSFETQLSQQTVALGASSHRASTHAAPRR
jgi:hypothetical protein